MGEKNGHYCVNGQMWDIDDDGYPTLVNKPSTLNVAKALLELFRDSDMRPEDECHVLYEAAELAVENGHNAESDLTSERAKVAKLREALQEILDATDPDPATYLGGMQICCPSDFADIARKALEETA